MDAKEIKVNIAKTKFITSGVGSGVNDSSGNWLCAVCKKGVRENYIQ